MQRYEDMYEFVFTNLKRIAFPEEFLAMDIEMSKQELFTIMIVDRLGEVTMGKLSEQMNFPMSTATGIIDRAVKKGYIQRGGSKNDRRIVALTLTDKGRSFADHLKNRISEYVKKAYDVLNEEERQFLFRIFNKVSSAFKEIGNTADKDVNESSVLKKIEIE